MKLMTMRRELVFGVFLVLSGDSQGQSHAEVSERKKEAFTRVLDRLDQIEFEMSSYKNQMTQLQNQVNDLLGKRGNITFQVRQVADPLILSDHAILKFDDVSLNEGNAYNCDTGVFTAPSPGLYLIWANIMSVSNNVFVIQVMRNGFEIDRGYTSDAGGYPVLTIDYMTRLEKGDQVWFENGHRPPTQTKIHGATYSSYGALKYM